MDFCLNNDIGQADGAKQSPYSLFTLILLPFKGPPYEKVRQIGQLNLQLITFNLQLSPSFAKATTGDVLSTQVSKATYLYLYIIIELVNFEYQ